ALSILVLALRIAIIAGVFVYAMWMLIRAIRQRLVRWRDAIRLAVPVTLLFPVASLLSMELMLKGYNTAIPLETYQAMSYLVLGMSVVFGFLLMAGAAALITTFYPEALAALQPGNRRVMALDAVLAVLVAAGFAVLSVRVQSLLVDRFHAQA